MKLCSFSREMPSLSVDFSKNSTRLCKKLCLGKTIM